MSWREQHLAVLEAYAKNVTYTASASLLESKPFNSAGGDSEAWRTQHKAILDGWGQKIDALGNNEKSFDPSKHPRGGDSHYPSRFSESAGSASLQQNARLRDRLPGAKPSPDAPGARSPEAVDATRSTRGQVRVSSRNESSIPSHSVTSTHLSPLHDSLEQSPIKRADRLNYKGINESYVLTLQDDTKGVYKPQQGEFHQARRGVPPKQCYKREVAASRIADVLGMGDLVPATVFRDQKGDGVGSMQKFVADTVKPIDSKDPFDGHKDAARSAVFDYLLGSLDRHKGNWLLQNEKLVLIDNGLSLPTVYNEKDFGNMAFWVHAAEKELPMPDLSDWKGKWDAIEKELRETGIEYGAIVRARQRFDDLTSGEYAKVADLPSLLDEGQTLGQMALYYNCAARDKRRAEFLAQQQNEILTNHAS